MELSFLVFISRSLRSLVRYQAEHSKKNSGPYLRAPMYYPVYIWQGYLRFSYYFTTFIIDKIQWCSDFLPMRTRCDVSSHKEFECHKRSVLDISVKFTEFMKTIFSLSFQRKALPKRKGTPARENSYYICCVALFQWNVTYRHFDNIEPPNTHFSQVTWHFSGFCTSRRKGRKRYCRKVKISAYPCNNENIASLWYL